MEVFAVFVQCKGMPQMFDRSIERNIVQGSVADCLNCVEGSEKLDLRCWSRLRAEIIMDLAWAECRVLLQGLGLLHRFIHFQS